MGHLIIAPAAFLGNTLTSRVPLTDTVLIAALLRSTEVFFFVTVRDQKSDKACNGHEYHQRPISCLTNPSIVQ